MPLDFIIQAVLGSCLTFSLWAPFSLCSQFYTDAGEILQLIYEQVMSMKINGSQICAPGEGYTSKSQFTQCSLLCSHCWISILILRNEWY